MTAQPDASNDARKQALLEAAQAAVSDVRSRQERGRSGRSSTAASRRTLLALGLTLFGVGVYLIAARPAWFFIPPAPTETVEIRDASFRLTMVREAELIRRFQAAEGRLPATLAEAGSQVQGVEYAPAPDGTFTLRATVAGEVLAYSSNDSATVFLGDSFGRILSRVTP
jgi:hypothetical protein